MWLEQPLLPCPWNQRCRHIEKRLSRIDWSTRFYTSLLRIVLGIAFFSGGSQPPPTIINAGETGPLAG